MFKKRGLKKKKKKFINRHIKKKKKVSLSLRFLCAEFLYLTQKKCSSASGKFIQSRPGTLKLNYFFFVDIFINKKKSQTNFFFV